MDHDQAGVLVLDFGSQYTRLIAKTIRELGVYSEVEPSTLSIERIRERKLGGIVLSGGPASVYQTDAPQLDPDLFRLGIPLLGICYGTQLITQTLGGQVARSTGEYGTATVELDQDDPLFEGLDGREQVWMSHGDVITGLPPHYRQLGSSLNAHRDHRVVAAIRDEAGSVYGLQFHPEVHHTPHGKRILENWLRHVCRFETEWVPHDLIGEVVEQLRAEIGEKRALIAVSGGVDSTTAAVLAHRAIGERLVPLTVDTGLLRKGEVERVGEVFAQLGLKVHSVDARERFLAALSGVTDPEAKRRAIGETFIRVFEDHARKLKAELGSIGVLIQGTIYSDVIESGGAGTASHAARIKSHHNVGGLPERLDFRVVEPLRLFFKDEVRQIGRALGIPDALIDEQPFPGPGLAVRILGEVTAERLEVLRAADAIVREEVARAGLVPKIWQYFPVLLAVRSVAVRGDGRGYGLTVGIRAVTSRDGMTADWYRFPHEVLQQISTRLTNELAEVTRVVYDITAKPPATIEWE